MSNFVLDVLKGGNNEISRLTDNDMSLELTASIGSILSFSIICLIIFFYNKEQSKWDIPLIILFYVCLYIIIISLGIGFLNLPLKTEENTNLFANDIQLGIRVILIPILIISVLIGSKIPRDKGEGYFEYMITHLLQTEEDYGLKKIGLLVLPIVYGLIEFATNEGNFTNLSTYYSSIVGIIGIVIIVVMKLVGIGFELLTNKNITTNLEEKPSNIVSEVIVLFTTIITILTNMTQRVEGLIFSSIILLLMLLGIKLILKIKTTNMYNIGLIIMSICMIFLIIFINIDDEIIYKEENDIRMVNIDLILYFISIGGFILGIKSIV